VRQESGPDHSLADDVVWCGRKGGARLPWIARDCGVDSDNGEHCLKVDAKRWDRPTEVSWAATLVRPKNIIGRLRTATTPALSPPRLCFRRGTSTSVRFPRGKSGAEDGHHEWSLGQRRLPRQALQVPHRAKVVSLTDIRAEVEIGYTSSSRSGEAQARLNCESRRDSRPLCIECDAASRIARWTDHLTLDGEKRFAPSV